MICLQETTLLANVTKFGIHIANKDEHPENNDHKQDPIKFGNK
jgi:hypothetical protein